MLDVILVDDELAALEELADKLEQIGGIRITGKYQDPEAALENIRKNPPDAVFLDIQMREIDGFTLAGEILRFDAKIEVVFATAYDEYAVKAFEINAVDYVLKPFIKERLAVTIKKITEKKQDAPSQNRDGLGILIRERMMRQSVKKIPVWSENQILILNPREIWYFTVENGKVTVVSTQGRYLSRDSLAFWEERLKEQRFFRTHKNFLVNLDKVRQVAPFFNYTYLLKLEGLNDEIPVSRNYLKEFKRVMFCEHKKF